MYETEDMKKKRLINKKLKKDFKRECNLRRERWETEFKEIIDIEKKGYAINFGSLDKLIEHKVKLTSACEWFLASEKKKRKATAMCIRKSWDIMGQKRRIK